MNLHRANKQWSLFPLKGFIAVSLLHFIFILPTKVSRSLGRFVGWLVFKLSSKKRHVILTNLNIAYPEMSLPLKLELAKKSTIHSGLLLSEFPDAWLGNRGKIQQQIIEVKNAELATAIQRQSLPLVVIAPHLGNWEFLVQWTQLNYPLIGLYSPSKIPQLDKLIFDARKKFGCKPYSTDVKGLTQLLRGLKQGGFMMMLPDQVPREGAGIESQFFGHPAYTMTLLHKLVNKSDARVLFAVCYRRPDSQGFNIEFEAADFVTSEPDVAIFNAGMNQQIESMINRFPGQYVWDYKRFRCQRNGSDPYK